MILNDSYFQMNKVYKESLKPIYRIFLIFFYFFSIPQTFLFFLYITYDKTNIITSIIISIFSAIITAYILSPIITQKEIRIYDDKIKLMKKYLEVIKISSIINKKNIKTIDIQLATHIGRFLYYRSPQKLWYNIIIQTKSKQYTYPVNFQPKGGIDLLKLISSFVDESILTENYKEILRKNRRSLIL